MVLADKALMVMDEVAVDAAGGPFLSDVIDLGVNRDLGEGQPIYFLVAISKTGASAGSAHVTCTIQQADDEAFTALPTDSYEAELVADTHAEGVLPVWPELYRQEQQDVTTGAHKVASVPPAPKRFVRVSVVATGRPSTVSIRCALGPALSPRIYPAKNDT